DPFRFSGLKHRKSIDFYYRGNQVPSSYSSLRFPSFPPPPVPSSLPSNIQFTSHSPPPEIIHPRHIGKPSVVLTGAIFVFLFRSNHHRIKRAKELDDHQGLCHLVTFVFKFNSIGLILYAWGWNLR
ncbi:hypothetical protein LINPERHAP1_LOCUS39696, partial [Linum perenne]